MRRLQVITVLVCVFLAATVPGIHTAAAGTFEQWSAVNDGLWGSDVTCLLRVPAGILAGTAREGVFMTTDEGQHWQWSGQGLPNMGTPAEPQYHRVLNLIASPAAIYMATEMGIYTSRDGGGSWQALGAALATTRVNCLAVDPASSDTLFAGTDDGVLVSADGGQTWTPRNEQMRRISVAGFTFDASAAGQLFACTGSGLYKSLDDGETWRNISVDLVGAAIQCLAQDPRRPDILFAGTSFGIYRSYDRGSTWTLLSPQEPAGSVLNIAIDSFDNSLLNAATRQGILVSVDGGEHWASSYHAVSGIQCCLWNQLAANPDAMLGTSSGPLSVTGSASSARVRGMGFLDVTAVAYDGNSGREYAVRGSFLYSGDGQSSWKTLESNLGNARVYGLAIDRNEPRLLYAATEYGILRSTDGGASWIRLAVSSSDARGKIQAVAVDPGDSRLVYGGNDYGLYRSDNGFQEGWTMVGPLNSGAIIGIAVVPSDGRTLYIASASSLWKTTDHCRTWQLVTDQLAPLDIVSLAVSGDGLTLYAGSGRGGLRSTDGGVTWHSLGADLDGLLVNSVVPGLQSQLLAGTSAGFFAGRTAQDAAGPDLRVDTPADRTVVSSPQVVVSGTVSDGVSGVASLSINGSAVTGITSGGQFGVTVALRQGSNQFVLRAVDFAGNVTEVPLTVTYQPVIVLQLTVGSSIMKVLPDKSVPLDAPPVILNGRTLVAIRPIVEALGGTVAWSAGERKVTIVQGGHTILLWIDRSTANVDGMSIPIDATSDVVVPKILSGRTMVPLRFVAEALGAQVAWDAVAKQITITYAG